MLLEKRLYIVVFKSKTTDETFIKVGVSAHAVERRFAADLQHFTIDLVAESRFYQSRDALIVESNFHQILKSHRYDPRIRLKSGNTECFVHCDDVLIQLCRIFNAKPTAPKEKEQPVRRPRRTHSERRQRHEAEEAAAMRWEKPSTLRKRQPDYHGGQRGWGSPYKSFG